MRAQVASIFHSVLACTVSLYMMYSMRYDTESVVYRGITTVDDFAQNLAAGFLTGHLVSDAAYSIVFKSKMPDYKMFWEMLFHHAIFGVALYCNLGNDDYYFISGFSILYFGEGSSIFLAWRWLLIRADKTDTAIFTFVSIMFALSFFLLRVVMFGRYVWGIVYNYAVVLNVLTPMAQFSAALQIVAFGLNLFWFVGIAKRAAAALEQRKTKKTT
eukprot:g566.t1